MKDLIVKFGNVSVGDASARIGVALDRAAIDLEAAEALFCGRQIWGKITLASKDDDAQGALFEGGSEPPTIESIMETKQLGVKPKAYSLGLTFHLESLDVSTLCEFAKKTGRLLVDEVRDIPVDPPASVAKPAAAIEDLTEDPDTPGVERAYEDNDLQEAYELGMEASADELDRDECPFHPSNEMELWAAWTRGFDRMEEFTGPTE